MAGKTSRVHLRLQSVKCVQPALPGFFISVNGTPQLQKTETYGVSLTLSSSSAFTVSHQTQCTPLPRWLWDPSLLCTISATTMVSFLACICQRPALSISFYYPPPNSLSTLQPRHILNCKQVCHLPWGWGWGWGAFMTLHCF